MESVGTFEAQTHLTLLIERVANGERIVITDRGKPVAMLVPAESSEPADAAEVGRAMLAYRDQVKRQHGGSSREMAHEGHRH